MTWEPDELTDDNAHPDRVDKSPEFLVPHVRTNVHQSTPLDISAHLFIYAAQKNIHIYIQGNLGVCSSNGISSFLALCFRYNSRLYHSEGSGVPCCLSDQVSQHIPYLQCVEPVNLWNTNGSFPLQRGRLMAAATN